MLNDQRPQVLPSGQNIHVRFAYLYHTMIHLGKKVPFLSPFLSTFSRFFLGNANKKSAHKHGHFGSIIPKTHHLQNQYTSEGKFQNLHQAAYTLNRLQIDKGWDFPYLVSSSTLQKERQ
ncbi:hypothetical protein ACUW84_001590 [Bacillus sp. 153480031-1]